MSPALTVAVWVVLIVFPCSAGWLVFRPQVPTMSRWRRYGLLAMIPYFTVLAADRSSVERVFEAIANLDPLLLTAYALAGSAASSVLIVELVRSSFPATATWPDRLHFSIVAAGWFVFFVVHSCLIRLGREMLHHGHAS